MAYTIYHIPEIRKVGCTKDFDRRFLQPGFTGWHCRFLEPEMDFPSISLACEVRTGESVAGHRVKVGIRVFPSISNLLDGIISTHLENPGLEDSPQRNRLPLSGLV